MKKIIALILSIIMVFSLLTVAFAAEYVEDEATKYPIILVPGYSSSALYTTDEETGEVIHVWGDAGSQIVTALDEFKEELLASIVESLAIKDITPFAKTFGEGFYWLYENMACNPDGTSVKDVKPYVHSAEETNYAYLRQAYPEGDHQDEKEMTADLGAIIGLENIYIHTCDFRMGAVENANSLRAYIDDVIEHHNKGKAEKDKIDKVNLFAVSHGGQVSGTYLTLYGHEGKVNNAVLTVPAMGGATLAYDALSGNVELDEYGLLQYIEHGMRWEEDYHVLLEAQKLGFLDDLLKALIPELRGLVKHWTSLWDFVPLEKYEELKAELLDAEENAELIAKSDYMHYEIMDPEGENYFGKGFKKAQQAGTNIYVMAGYDAKSVSGMNVSSDAIVPISGATGATVAEFGKRFSDGYTQKVDTGFYQVSPSMTIDASTAYLPEHTWFIENYYHGMTNWDNYTKDLLFTLLLNDKSYDVHSMPEHPQFHATTNPSHSVFAAFDKSTEGYVSSEDKSLVVTNCSWINDITVISVNARGLDIDFTFLPFKLAPGESKEIKFEGDIPEVSAKNFEINISFLMGTITPISDRTLDFTVLNGEKAAYDAASPLTDADMPSEFDALLSGDLNTIFKETGLKGTLSIIYNMIYKVLDFLFNLREFIS